MKLIKVVAAIAVLGMILIGCQSNKIQLDDPEVEGLGPGAKAVLELAKSKLGDINTIHATIRCYQDSEMYGREEAYKGTLKAEYNEEQGMGNRWFEAKETVKGGTKHVRGVHTEKGLTELHLLHEKVIKGEAEALPSVMITNSLSAYSRRGFFDQFENKENQNPNIPENMRRQMSKNNTYLEAIKTIEGRECYVIKMSPQGMEGRMAFRYYFGVKDGHFYGESTEANGQDGKLVTEIVATDLTFNKELPSFELEVPENYAVQMWTAPWDAKSLQTGMQAQDWTLETSKGTKTTLSKEYKNNVVLLDFWATWCGPCKAKMPFVQKMHEKYKDKGLKVISVLSSDAGHEEAAVAYLKKHGYTFDLVYGTNAVAKQYKIRFLPTVMMIDDTGKIVYFRDTLGVNDGIDEKVELEDAIKKALKVTS